MSKIHGALAAGLLLATGVAESAELRYSMFQPPRTIEAVAMENFLDELGEKTEGRVTGKMFPGGQLLSGPATLKGIKDGVADMGFIVLSFTLGELKHANIVADLQLYATDPYVAAGAANETIMADCKECAADFEAQNSLYLGGHAATPWQLMCRQPIGGLADLAGRKVRVTGAWATRLASSLGMVSVQLPGTEIAAALSAGQIDCTVGPLLWLKDFALWDSIRSVLEVPLGSSPGLGLFVTNKDSFEEMEPEDRATLLDLATEHAVKAMDEYPVRNQTVRDEAGSHGVTFVEPDAAFTEALKKFKQADIPNVVADMEERGVANAQEVVDIHLKNIEEWEKLVAEIGEDRAEYVETLDERTTSALRQ